MVEGALTNVRRVMHHPAHLGKTILSIVNKRRHRNKTGGAFVFVFCFLSSQATIRSHLAFDSRTSDARGVGVRQSRNHYKL